MYWIKYNSQNKYVYAYKDLTLLGYDRLSTCINCNRPIVTPIFSASVPQLCFDGAGEFPDHLQFTGAGRQLFLISEKALEIYEKNHISGYSGYHLVNISSDGYSGLEGNIPPYYSLDITGSIDLDFLSMHLKKKKVCAKCGQYEWNRTRMSPMILDLSQWDGSDLCLLRTFPGFKLCSPKLREMITEGSLTGVSLVKQ